MKSETVEKVMQSKSFHSQLGTTKEKGSGLGLKLCKDFVEQHNRELTTDSEPDIGTTVRFTIPKN